MKEIMKNMDLRISDISIQMGISRPTMYKFIEMYESGETKSINKDVLKLFNFIEKNKYTNKNHVLKFILNDLSETAKYSSEKNELIELVKALSNKQAIELLKKIKGE